MRLVVDCLLLNMNYNNDDGGDDDDDDDYDDDINGLLNFLIVLYYSRLLDGYCKKRSQAKESVKLAHYNIMSALFWLP